MKKMVNFKHGKEMWKVNCSTWHEHGTKKNPSPRQESNPWPPDLGGREVMGPIPGFIGFARLERLVLKPRHKVTRKRLGCVRLGSIRNKKNWNSASKRLFGSHSHSGIPGFPFRLFYSQEQNSRNTEYIFLFRNIPNERALIYLAPVVQRLDNAIQWINHYPVDSMV